MNAVLLRRLDGNGFHGITQSLLAVRFGMSHVCRVCRAKRWRTNFMIRNRAGRYAGAALVIPYGGRRQIRYSHSIVLGGLELTS
jgi:hypothetical protein